MTTLSTLDQALAAGSAPIAVALDAPNSTTMVDWAIQSAPHVSVMKVGLEVYLRDGAVAVEQVREAAPAAGVFLDLKLHDIPATVGGAARSIARLQPDIVTVHAAGGASMIAAAAEALPQTRIAGVTILTSMSDKDLAAVGFDGDSRTCVTRLAVLAVNAGARALVCSPLEVAFVRDAVGPDVLLITPGVRPAGASGDDQSRVASPASALASGADLLVIGRPITAAEDPAAAAAAIAEEIRRR